MCVEMKQKNKPGVVLVFRKQCGKEMEGGATICPHCVGTQTQVAQTRKPAETTTVNLGTGVPLDLVWIPAGEFLMGSPMIGRNHDEREIPQHKVRITRGFWMGKYEVTQAQWKTVMGNNPSQFKKNQNPVEMVSWNDSQDFLKKLSQKAGGTFRLPTEAEWEYACRAGSTTEYCFGDDESRLGDYAWYFTNSGSKPYSVGRKKPNAWGLYDMHGNIWEWCEDYYDECFYSKSPVENPCNTGTEGDRVLRGGVWGGGADLCRSAARAPFNPAYTLHFIGFRVVCVSSR